MRRSRICMGTLLAWWSAGGAAVPIPATTPTPETTRGGVRGRRAEPSYSIALEPWGECTSDCVALRNVLCTTQNGQIADESKCDGISDIKHYRVCNDGDCGATPHAPTPPTRTPVRKPTHTPTSKPTLKNNRHRQPPTVRPTRSPTHAPTPKRRHDDDDDDDDDDGSESNLVDPSDVLTHIVDGKSTTVPTVAPTSGVYTPGTYARGSLVGSDRNRGSRSSGNGRSSAQNARMAGLVTLMLLGLVLSIILTRAFLRWKEEPVQYSKLNQIDNDDVMEFPEGLCLPPHHPHSPGIQILPRRRRRATAFSPRRNDDVYRSRQPLRIPQRRT